MKYSPLLLPTIDLKRVVIKNIFKLNLNSPKKEKGENFINK